MTKTEKILFFICLIGGCALTILNVAVFQNLLVIIAAFAMLIAAVVLYGKGKKREKNNTPETARDRRNKELEAQRNASYSQIRARKKAEKAQKEEKNQ